ncbi:MAG: hypothetical protein QS748_14155 [Candidatus Endonucleobacter bathymodioli]|uniref:Uncharacterized protein n=1 Tax=Candidatus Endonucleibacter bathymodioli TaxID=539814 RepID=A0AA90SE92_9GAMM|nr:hypothetical protein [Candidatus Endonucleobacter bathymodioli]
MSLHKIIHSCSIYFCLIVSMFCYQSSVATYGIFGEPKHQKIEVQYEGDEDDYTLDVYSNWDQEYSYLCTLTGGTTCIGMMINTSGNANLLCSKGSVNKLNKCMLPAQRQKGKRAVSVELISPYLLGSLKKLLNDTDVEVEDPFMLSLPDALSNYIEGNIASERHPVFVIDGLELASRLQQSIDEYEDECLSSNPDLSSDSDLIEYQKIQCNNAEWRMTIKDEITVNPENSMWEGLNHKFSFSLEPTRWCLAAETEEQKANTQYALAILSGIQCSDAAIVSRVNGFECITGIVKLPGQDLDVSIVNLTPSHVLKIKNDGFDIKELVSCSLKDLSSEMCTSLLQFLPESNRKWAIIRRVSQVCGGFEMLLSLIQQRVGHDLDSMRANPLAQALESRSFRSKSNTVTMRDALLSSSECKKGTHTLSSGSGSENAADGNVTVDAATGSENSEKAADENVTVCAATSSESSEKAADGNVTVDAATDSESSDKVADENVTVDAATGSENSEKGADENVTVGAATGSESSEKAADLKATTAEA